MLAIKAVLGILVAVAGAHLGLRALLYISIALVAGFAAWSTNRGFFYPISSRFALFTTKENATVITFIMLTLVPLLTVGYFGRILITKLKIDKDVPNKTANSILGCGFALTVYIIILCLI